jgi:hypothetical protein
MLHAPMRILKWKLSVIDARNYHNLRLTSIEAKTWKVSSKTYFEVLFQHFNGVTEENEKTFTIGIIIAEIRIT